MIKVRSPLEVEPDPQGGWHLVFWAREPFDLTTPFRAMLAEMAEALGQHRPSDLQLPLYEEGEDFVEGTSSSEPRWFASTMNTPSAISP